MIVGMEMGTGFGVGLMLMLVGFIVWSAVTAPRRRAESAAQQRKYSNELMERLTAKRDDLVTWTGLKDASLAAKLLPEISDLGFDIGRLGKIEFSSPEWKAEEAARQAERAASHAAVYNAMPLREKIALKRRWLAENEADFAAYSWLRQHLGPVIARLRADIAGLEAEAKAAR